MARHAASAHDQKELQRRSRSKPQGKVVPIKKPAKKPARKKATKTTTVAIAEPMVDGPSVNDDVQVRIAERAYELHHRRGGHHGQDLDDWLTAEREVQSEESCA